MPVRSLFLFFIATLAATAQAQPTNPVSLLPFVNPFIGTGGHGHTYPGATAPFGLVQLSPDTRISMLDWDGCSGYHDSDSLLYGFSHTHLSGTGVPDYCDVLFLPFVGGARLEPEEYAAPFHKNNEHAEAGYYSVLLDRSRIQCELTATERVGVHRYTFPPNREKGGLLIDLRHRDEVLDAHLEVINDHEIAGYRISNAWAKEQHVYFVARFSRPFFSSIVLDMAQNPRVALPAVTSKAILGLLNFNNDAGPIVITVGISGVSMDGARRNLEAECPDFDFDKIKAATQEKWQQQLRKIVVEGGTADQKTIFYTALYHTMVVPNIWNDVDGQYRGRDNAVHPNPGHDVYTVFSLWDTHRAANPLYTILEPKRTNDFIQTFLRQYEQGGLLPIWELSGNETDCMIGNHAIPVIADAYLKGIRGYDAQEALAAMLKSVGQDRLGMSYYRTLGYIPADKEPESVSKTLEYAYDDWCLAQMAKALRADSIAARLGKRSYNYLNIYDPVTQFFRPKSNASWVKPFDPYEVNFNFTEANAWQYRFAVPQNIPGLINLMGHEKAFENQLDSLFMTSSRTTGRTQADITGLIGQYVHGNEPSHHIAYLYNAAGQSWKTQQRVRQIMDEMYSNRPDGLSGNEDCGQMSAWLVFSALGFYPVTPASNQYSIGTPWFEKMTLQVEGGRQLVIRAPGVSKQRFYVKNIRLDGREHPQNQLSHADLVKGGELVFDLSDTPTSWGKPDVAYQDWKMPAAPFVAEGERVFKQSQTIRLGSLFADDTLYYTLDGTRPTRKSRRYTKPFQIEKATTTLQAIAVNGSAESALATATFTKIDPTLRLDHYNTRYNAQYTAHGEEALINGVRGGADFRTGDWQGFEGVNLDIVLDLGKIKPVKQVSIGFLQDENAWIFFPSQVQVETSEDGKNFTAAGSIANTVPTTDKGVLQHDFTIPLSSKKARYVRVVGVSLGQCPANHKGVGHPCWIFADEVGVE